MSFYFPPAPRPIYSPLAHSPILVGWPSSAPASLRDITAPEPVQFVLSQTVLLLTQQLQTVPFTLKLKDVGDGYSTGMGSLTSPLGIR